jgi:3-oxoacyl-[acyl-carrier protein] reductase
VGTIDGKTAIVTGGAQGIGLEIARTFAREGANVVIADLNPDEANSAVSDLCRASAAFTAVRCDVTEEDDVEALIHQAMSKYGRLDIMVNNAGITRDATLRRLTLQDFKKVLDVHLVGTWLGTRFASAVMREQASGSIINMSSISGKVGVFGQTNYSAAKAGIVGLTKASAKELAGAGVRVNAIQPGLIRTAMTEALDPDIWSQKVAEIPMGRAGEPEDVANVALFLASKLSSYMTGAVIEVAGGRFM